MSTHLGGDLPQVDVLPEGALDLGELEVLGLVALLLRHVLLLQLLVVRVVRVAPLLVQTVLLTIRLKEKGQKRQTSYTIY